MPIFLPWDIYTQYPTGTNIVGTESNDTYSLLRSQTTFVDMRGGHDTLTLGGTGDFFVDLGTGNDTVTIGNFGNTDVDGGAGLDRFYVSQYGDHDIDGGAGNDTLDFSKADEGVRLHEGNFQSVDGSSDWSTYSNIEYVHGSDHDDSFIPGASWSSAWDGRVKFFLGDGNDQAVGSDFDDLIKGEAGKDTILLGNGSDRGLGGEGADKLYGGYGNDTLWGNDGRDKLTAGAGADRIFGGDDADVIYAVGPGSNGYVRDTSSDFFDGGFKVEAPNYASDADTLSYEHAHGAVTIDVDAGLVTGVGAGYFSVDNGDGTATVNFATDRFTNIEIFHGSDFDDLFIGSSRLGYYENVSGGYGADVFKAGLAGTTFNGGYDLSVDVADYSDIQGRIDADLNTGIVTIYDTDGADIVRQRLMGVEHVIGTDGNDQMTGSDQRDILAGGLGNDLLNGRARADVFEFSGADGFFGYDRVADFGRGDDQISLADLHLTNGAGGGSVDAFSDLDTSGDGQLTEADAPVFGWGDTLLIQFQEGYVEFHDPAPLTEDAFIFG